MGKGKVIKDTAEAALELILGPLATVDLPPGSKPRYRGAAPDRAGGSFPRYRPKKAPERMDRLIGAADDPTHVMSSLFDRHVLRGQDVGGSDWYNTEELRDWFTDELGPKGGDASWRDFIDNVGATSTGSAVPDNIRNASFYSVLDPDARRTVSGRVSQGGITPGAAFREAGLDGPRLPPASGPGSYNYGHVMQANHGSNILNQLDGMWAREVPENLTGAERTKWLQANPKVKGFANNLLGDRTNIAADKHFMRMLAMADGSPDFLSEQAAGSADMLTTLREAYGAPIEGYISTRSAKGKPVVQVNLAKAAKDGVITDAGPLQSLPGAWADTPAATEYAALEDMATRLSRRYDMTPAQLQANLWMGAGDVTGLATESQGTFMDLFRRSLDKKAKDVGSTRRDVLRDFINKKAPLAVGPAGILALMAEEERT